MNDDDKVTMIISRMKYLESENERLFAEYLKALEETGERSPDTNTNGPVPKMELPTCDSSRLEIRDIITN